MRYRKTGGLARKYPALLSHGEDRQDTTDDISMDVH